MKKLFFILIPFILTGFLIITGALPEKEQNRRERKRERSEQRIQESEQRIQESEQRRDQSVHRNSALKCNSCHASEYPTKDDPGLHSCPRGNIISVYHSPAEGPEIVRIGGMSDKYSEVIFSHRIHAEMSEMSKGCTGCHHYNTTGYVQNCRNCHSTLRAREDVSVPDLKAAYHRQCMSCHKQWSGENGCNGICHVSKGTNREKNFEEVTGKTHPKLPEPGKIVWETRSETNKIVTFFHDEHVKLFKIECKSCHNDNKCIKCHSSSLNSGKSNPVKIEKTFEEHHQPCSNCHYGNSCRKCHHDKEMTPFDHGKNGGWVLKSYHSSIACSKCHGSTMPYRKLSNKCSSCHKNFTNEFDHKLVGFTFSEAHTGLECANCHSKSDFTKSPVCTDCHDDKSFPADLPGSRKE